MRTVEQVEYVITNSSFVEIDNYFYRVESYTSDTEEKMLYLFDEDGGEEVIYDLNNEQDMNILQYAGFYEIRLIDV
jgi:hypothetical protein